MNGHLASKIGLSIFAFVVVGSSAAAKTAIVFGGAGSGGERYGRNAEEAARFYLQNGYDVKILAGVYPNHTEGWAFLKSSEFAGKVQFTNLYDAKDSAGAQKILSDTVKSAKGPLAFFSTDHGSLGSYIVDNSKRDIPRAAVDQMLSDYHDAHPQDRITMLGVECYSGKSHAITAHVPNSCSSAGTDAVDEHASDEEQNIALHAQLFFNASVGRADLNGDGQLDMFERHYDAKLHDPNNFGLNGISSVEFARSQMTARGKYKRPHKRILDAQPEDLRAMVDQLNSGFGSAASACSDSQNGLGTQMSTIGPLASGNLRPLTEGEIAKLPAELGELYRREFPALKARLQSVLPQFTDMAKKYLGAIENINAAVKRERELHEVLWSKVQAKTGCDNFACDDLLATPDELEHMLPEFRNEIHAWQLARTNTVDMNSAFSALKIESLHFESTFNDIALLDDFNVVARFQQEASAAELKRFGELYSCESQPL